MKKTALKNTSSSWDIKLRLEYKACCSVPNTQRGDQTSAAQQTAKKSQFSLQKSSELGTPLESNPRTSEGHHRTNAAAGRALDSMVFPCVSFSCDFALPPGGEKDVRNEGGLISRRSCRDCFSKFAEFSWDFNWSEWGGVPSLFDLIGNHANVGFAASDFAHFCCTHTTFPLYLWLRSSSPPEDDV